MLDMNEITIDLDVRTMQEYGLLDNEKVLEIARGREANEFIRMTKEIDKLNHSVLTAIQTYINLRLISIKFNGK